MCSTHTLSHLPANFDALHGVLAGCVPAAVLCDNCAGALHSMITTMHPCIAVGRGSLTSSAVLGWGQA